MTVFGVSFNGLGYALDRGLIFGGVLGFLGQGNAHHFLSFRFGVFNGVTSLQDHRLFFFTNDVYLYGNHRSFNGIGFHLKTISFSGFRFFCAP